MRHEKNEKSIERNQEEIPLCPSVKKQEDDPEVESDFYDDETVRYMLRSVRG
jgi:hypothetical protein